MGCCLLKTNYLDRSCKKLNWSYLNLSSSDGISIGKLHFSIHVCGSANDQHADLHEYLFGNITTFSEAILFMRKLSCGSSHIVRRCKYAVSRAVGYFTPSVVNVPICYEYLYIVLTIKKTCVRHICQFDHIVRKGT